MKRVIYFVYFLILNLSLYSYAEANIGDAIDLYQKGSYKECINTTSEVVKQDPTSALGYYYLALAYTKTNQKELAIKNYDKVIALGSDKTLVSLAKTGKSKLDVKKKQSQPTGVGVMLEDPDEVKKVEQEPKPEVKQELKQEPQKVEEPKKEPKPQKAKSSDGMPTNDEIVNAIRVLQRAGLLQNGLGGLSQPQQAQQQPQQAQYQQQSMPQNYNVPVMDERTREMQAMMMMMNSNNGYGNNNSMMNMLPYVQSGGKMSPEMVKMMMMQQMMPDFSSNSNNNHGY